MTASLHSTTHDRDRREWGDSGNFKKGRRKPGIEFTASEKKGGHSEPLCMSQTKSATVSRHFPPWAALASPAGEDGEQQSLSQCTLLLLHLEGSQSITVSHHRTHLLCGRHWGIKKARALHPQASQVSQRPGKHIHAKEDRYSDAGDHHSYGRCTF